MTELNRFSPVNPNGLSTGRTLAQAINFLLSGGRNDKIEFTLTANSATTVLTDPRLGVGSVLKPMPLTANAAAALGGMYASSQGTGTITLTHANNAQVDRSFRAEIGR